MLSTGGRFAGRSYPVSGKEEGIYIRYLLADPGYRGMGINRTPADMSAIGFWRKRMAGDPKPGISCASEAMSSFYCCPKDLRGFKYAFLLTRRGNLERSRRRG